MGSLAGDTVAADAVVGRMDFLVDTNVLFAAKHGRREAVAWLREVAPERCYFSVITIGAIMKALPDLDDWLEQLKNSYATRILPVDAAVAIAWGKLEGLRERVTEDGLIAATAAVHRLAVVTVINPYV